MAEIRDPRCLIDAEDHRIEFALQLSVNLLTRGWRCIATWIASESSGFTPLQDGGSAFDEVEIPFIRESTDAWGNLLRTSERFDSQGVQLFEAPEGTFQDWHNAPRRQLCFMLTGVWEIGTTDGEFRRWGPGQIFLPADVNGQGHTSRVIEGPVRILFVPLGEETQLESIEST